MECPECEADLTDIDEKGFCTCCGCHVIINPEMLSLHREKIQMQMPKPQIPGPADNILPAASQQMDSLAEQNNNPDSPLPAAGQEILGDRYQVTAYLAEGGFGSTYLARHTGFGDEVVIKKLKNSRHGKSLELFEREARVQRTLAIKGVPKIFDYFKDEDAVYLVQEYIPGLTLRKIMRNRKLAESEIISLARQLLCIVGELQAARIIHRDIKPENILLKEKQQVYLIDFGCCKILDLDTPCTYHTVIVSEGYTAREQKFGRLTYESDLFSTGMILAEAWSGLNITKIINNLGELKKEILPSTGNFIVEVIRNLVDAGNPAQRLEGVKILNQNLPASERIPVENYRTMADASVDPSS